MRWSIIRTIWVREMRDQLRDRRTLIMILGLPLVLYPVLGFAVLQFAVGFVEKPSVVGFVTGSEERKEFPPRPTEAAGRHVAPELAWLTATPSGQLHGVIAFAYASHRTLDYPPLVSSTSLRSFDAKRIKLRFLAQDNPRLLAEREVDLILETDADFYAKLDTGDDPAKSLQALVHIRSRPDDDRSRLALRRLNETLLTWKQDLKKVRMARAGLPPAYIEPVDIQADDEKNVRVPRENVINNVVRLFPVLLVMWCLAGALYPAVDLCAGEKERGTMETLLITPAGREEIVLGKFLTIWVFSLATAVLNVLSMGITTAICFRTIPQADVSLAALFWCVALSVPQSAFFSALALAIGAYARSSKEGQYYLMPLFVVTMPLVFLTMAPGVEMSPLYSLVPVTGVALLMQKLMTARSLAEIPWAYFVPVFFPVGVYSWLALRWAIEQFNREDVLFREAERVDLSLWLRSLFRQKEPLPTTGQAYFALALLIGLRWLSLGLGNQWPASVRAGIIEVVFVAMPPILMAMVLNTQAAESFYLRVPRWREAGLAALLALLTLPPMIGVTQFIASQYPRFIEGAHPLITILRETYDGRTFDTQHLVLFLLAFAVVPALAEELAFRGFVLRGLQHTSRPRHAVLLSSFFFGLFQLNVFLFVPTFLLGVVVSLLTVRTRSIWPAIAFHFLYNGVLIALIPLRQSFDGALPAFARDAWAWLIGICLVFAVVLVWRLYRKPYVDLMRYD